MASEPEIAEWDDLLQEIKTGLEDLETELGKEAEKGKGTNAALTADIRTRIQELRDGEQEPTQTYLDKLREKLDGLSAEIQEKIVEGTKRASSIVDDVKRQVQELEQMIRGR